MILALPRFHIRWGQWVMLILCLSCLSASLKADARRASGGITQANSYLRVTYSLTRPEISELSVDSLGRGKFHRNQLLPTSTGEARFSADLKHGWIEYGGQGHSSSTALRMRCVADGLEIESHFKQEFPTDKLTLRFDPDVVHATLLGHFENGGVRLPALLHLPGSGSLQIYGDGRHRVLLGYDAHRGKSRFVEVSFPLATKDQPHLSYRLKVVDVYPRVPGVDLNQSQFDGFRRDFLDIYQLQAQWHVLANNAASDPCPFTLYFAADMARFTPPLVDGLTANDLIRDTLDQYLHGFKGYGMPGFHMFEGDDHSQQPYTFLDVYPSLLISAYDYVESTQDTQWLSRNYVALKRWTNLMEEFNEDGSPMLEYPASGNSGSWVQPLKFRPSNWWDTIGFGFKDAYSNALGYRALLGMAKLASHMHDDDDAVKFTMRAHTIRDAYAREFLDRSSQSVAGWRSRDGKLHDYHFTFINGIAVRYGLLDTSTAQVVMSTMMRELKEDGFTNFGLGLPGNLIPIRRADYVDLNPRYGGPEKEDGSDGYQIYENGGATACFSYFTMAALYKVGERAEADQMLMAMLDSFSQNRFSGSAPDGMTYDWKDWHGNAHGYEGFLVDNYYAFLALLDRAGMVETLSESLTQDPHKP